MSKNSVFKLCYSSEQVKYLFSKLTVLNTQPVLFMFTHLYVNVAALNLVRRRPGIRRVSRESDVILFLLTLFFLSNSNSKETIRAN